MAAKEMKGNVEAIEVEAEKILEEARGKASDILLKANEEVNKILSAKLPMDKVKKEQEKIVNKAKKEADDKVEESKKKASEIKAEVEKKAGKIIERIVGNITGAESK